MGSNPEVIPVTRSAPVLSPAETARKFGISAKALGVILKETLSGAPLAEVAEVPGDIVYRIFGRELSMGKSMGLMAMVSMIQASARKALQVPQGA